MTGDDGITPVVGSLDVKYTVYTGYDFHLDPDLVQPHVELESRGRRRRMNVEPATETENDQPNQHPQQQGRSKRRALDKKPNKVGSAENSNKAVEKKAPPKKTTPTKQEPHKVRVHKKSTKGIVQAAVSPSTGNAIPREIFIDPSKALDSSFSPLDPKKAPYSPLGQEGVESQPVSSASYMQMVAMPSDTCLAERNMSRFVQEDDNHNGSNSSDEVSSKFDDGNNERQVHLSPFSQGRKLELNLAAAHLGVGYFLTENTKKKRVKSPKKKTRIASAVPAKPDFCSARIEKDSVASDEKSGILVQVSAGAVEAVPGNTLPDVSSTQECSNESNNNKTAARVHLSLRQVFDNGVKKASQFIGDVVTGAPKLGAPHDNDTDTLDDKGMQRLNRFRSFLNAVLLNCDGMMEVTTVFDQMMEYATTQAGGLTFDYTDDEVNDYLTQLCAQNKIMRTEGWIYNI